MSTRQIKLYAKPQAGNDITTTISNVNPNADGETMENFAKMLNRFTNNTYQKSDLVETTNLDTETVTKRKKMPTLRFTSNEINVDNTSWPVPIECDSDAAEMNDGLFASTGKIIASGTDYGYRGSAYNVSTKTLTIAMSSSGQRGSTFQINVACQETENYYAATAKTTLTMVRS